MADNTAWDVFLSYSMPEDKHIVEKIAADLEAQGVSCWYADRNHEHFEFTDVIPPLIPECRGFVLIVTEHSYEGHGFIAHEAQIAYRRYLKDRFSFDIQVFCLDGYKIAIDNFNIPLSKFPQIDGGYSSNPDTEKLVHRVVKFLEHCEPKKENPSEAEQPNVLANADNEPKEEAGKEQEEIAEIALDTAQEMQQEAEEERKRKRKRALFLAGTLVALIAICIAVWFFLPPINSSTQPPTQTPNPPISVLELTPEELRYQEAETLAQNKDKSSRLEAAMIWASLGDYRDSKKRSFAIWDEYQTRETLSAGNGYTVGVFRDGHAASKGRAISMGNERSGQSNISEWSGIMAVSAGENHAVGLCENGAAVGVGKNLDGLRSLNWSEWSDIIAVSAGNSYTAALRKDGKVLYVNNALPRSAKFPQPPPPPHYGFFWGSFSDFVAISAGGAGHTVGLRANGAVEVAGANEYGRCNVKGAEWNDIIAVSAGYEHTVGLHRDGTVIAVGLNKDGQCDVGGWRNIAAISAGGYHTVGLDEDGNVYATGNNKYGQCDVDNWPKMSAISAGWGHTVGLTKNGAVLIAGAEAAGIDANQIPEWDDIRFPNE